MSRSLQDSVVVVTGASSGIGRATALAFADREARLVLGARDDSALREVARSCDRRGGRALIRKTDVRSEEEVEALARTATDAHGHLDVWVNNAAVSAFGRFEAMPHDVFREVFETNLFGYVYGLRAALRRFRDQGSGVAVNVLSAVTEAPQPYTSAYVSTKFALRGLIECLRMELALDEDHDIHVCSVLPPSIDTPLFQHAANFTGRGIRPMDPVFPVERAAEKIVDVAEEPRREAWVGVPGAALKALRVVAPAPFEHLMARRVDRKHLTDASTEPSEGNVFSSSPESNELRGGWRSGGTRSAVKIAAAAVLAVGVPLLLWTGR